MQLLPDRRTERRGRSPPRRLRPPTRNGAAVAGPTSSTTAAMTAATNPTWGFASQPIPTTTPAASTDGPLPRTTARIISQTERGRAQQIEGRRRDEVTHGEREARRRRARGRDDLRPPRSAELTRDQRRENRRRRRDERGGQPQDEQRARRQLSASPRKAAERAAADRGSRMPDATRRR